MKPLQDYLHVHRDEPKVFTDGGIALPEGARKRTQRGTVLAAGPGLRNEKTGARIPMEIAVGDRVLFCGLSGNTVDLDDKVFLIRESHLEGRID